MNLGQAIDPEWARAGCPEMFPRPRSAGAAVVLRVVDHVDKKSQPASDSSERRIPVPRRVRKVLAGASKPLTASEIAEIDGTLGVQNVASAMTAIVNGRQVTRSGPRGAYSYVLTPLGRAMEAKERDA